MQWDLLRWQNFRICLQNLNPRMYTNVQHNRTKYISNAIDCVGSLFKFKPDGMCMLRTKAFFHSSGIQKWNTAVAMLRSMLNRFFVIMIFINFNWITILRLKQIPSQKSYTLLHCWVYCFQNNFIFNLSLFFTKHAHTLALDADAACSKSIQKYSLRLFNLIVLFSLSLKFSHMNFAFFRFTVCLIMTLLPLNMKRSY